MPAMACAIGVVLMALIMPGGIMAAMPARPSFACPRPETTLLRSESFDCVNPTPPPDWWTTSRALSAARSAMALGSMGAD
jgi:hypothetical protein